MNSDRKRNSGFTVIELMIVIVIVAILVALAYPSYVKYARKAKRGDAQQTLMNWAINQEIWRSNHTSYTTGDGLNPTNSSDYSYTVTAGTTSYTLTATPQGDQAKDESRNGTTCSPLTLTESGVKQPAVCWE